MSAQLDYQTIVQFLTESELAYLAKNRKAFEKGIDLARKIKQEDIHYDKEKSLIFAYVSEGKNHFLISISFELPPYMPQDFFGNVEIKNIDILAMCTCSFEDVIFDEEGLDIEDFVQAEDFCRHTIAVLKAFADGKYVLDSFENIQEKMNQILKEIISKNSYSQTSMFSHLYEYISGNMEENIIQYTLNNFKKETPNVFLEKYFGSSEKDIVSLKLKIKASNINRDYVISDIPEFLRAYEQKLPVEFGKYFVFNPSYHFFSEKDKKLLELLAKYIEITNPGEEKSTLFIPAKIANEIIEIFDNEEIFIAIDSFLANYYLSDKVKINLSAQVKPKIAFKFEDNQIRLYTDLIDIKNRKLVYSDGSFFISNGILYKLTPEQRIISTIIKKVEETNRTIDKNFTKIHIKFIPFTLENFLDFINKYYLYLKQHFELEIDPALKKFILEDHVIKPKLYLEIENERFVAKIGGMDEMLDTASKTKKVPLFDYLGLFQLQSILFAHGFYEIESDEEFEYECVDPDMFMEFLSEGILQVQKIADVYYSEDFKKLKIKKDIKIIPCFKHSGYSVDFWFESDELDSTELKNILDAIKKKKKYYKLKDGSILIFENPKIRKLSSFIESASDIGQVIKEKARLSLPEAVAITKLLDESGIQTKGIESVKSIIEKIENIKEIDIQIPLELQDVLREYQKIGIKWLSSLYENGLGGILADDMGLGKTVQVLGFILANRQKINKPVLIIVPTSLIYNWKQEIDKFAPGLKALIIDSTPAKRKKAIEKIPEYDIVITSYALFRKDVELYRDIYFSVCILDEAQYIKNPSSQIKLAVKEISADSKFALTGTPIENNLMELWSIFDFILPGYFGSADKFIDRFMTPIYNGNNIALEKLKKLIKPFVLRRVKQDVLNELPELIETTVQVAMNPEQEKIYKQFLASAKEEIEKEIDSVGFEKSQIKILSLLTRLRQICCHPKLVFEDYKGGSGKLEALKELLQDSIESGHRVIIYSQWTSMLSIIQKVLDKEKIEYFYLDGATKAEDRVEMVNRFNSGERKVFLLSLKAGGFGLNITGADVVIHFDAWWNPAVESQATARAHRLGQKNVVQSFKIIAKNSIEEKILQLQQKKKDLFDSLIEANQAFATKLTKEEIMEILG